MLKAAALVADIRSNLATMELARAVTTTIASWVASHQLKPTYPDTHQLLTELGVGHPRRARLQVMASSATTAEDFKKVMAEILTALLEPSPFAAAA